jgi:hypothetical protein
METLLTVEFRRSGGVKKWDDACFTTKVKTNKTIWTNYSYKYGGWEWKLEVNKFKALDEVN